MLRGGSLTWGACSPQGKPGALRRSMQPPHQPRGAMPLQALNTLRLPPGGQLPFPLAGCWKSPGTECPKGAALAPHIDYPFGRRFRISVVLFNDDGNGQLKRSAPVNRGRRTYVQNILCTNWCQGTG